MKNYKLIFTCALIFNVFDSTTIAQTSLGTINDFMSEIKSNIEKNKKGTEKIISLKIDNKLTLNAKVNYEKSESNYEYLVGEIKDTPESTFFIEIKNNTLNGHIILMKSKEAYKYNTDKAGNAYLSHVDINSLICIGFDEHEASNNQLHHVEKRNTLIDPALLLLESFPGATGCILLDFDGHNLPAGTIWNQGNPATAVPTNLKNEDIKIHWELVSEDYRPFNFNVTTNESVFNNYPKNKRMRVVITPEKPFSLGGGGVAILGSFGKGETDVCWVFNSSNGRVSGETASHEIGHTLDLQHDATLNGTGINAFYYLGIKDTPFVPIMGGSNASRNPVAQFDKGEYNDSNNNQDDLALITDAKFGIGYRKDDYNNSIEAASPLEYDNKGIVFKKNGVIANEEDIDFFTFKTTASGSINLMARTVEINGNLDIIMRLYDSTGKEIESFTDTTPAVLNATFTKTLPPGKYYISIDGTGAGDPKTGGYSAYASVGSYTISGTIPNGALLTTSDFDTALSKLNVHPNPFQDELNITIDSDLTNKDLKFYDSIGKLINIVPQKSNDNTYLIDTSGIPAGIYYLKITANNASKTVKIAKQ
jgi:hypothetical protein